MYTSLSLSLSTPVRLCAPSLQAASAGLESLWPPVGLLLQVGPPALQFRDKGLRLPVMSGRGVTLRVVSRE